MKENYYNKYVNSLSECLAEMIVTNIDGQEIEQESSFLKLCNYSSSVQNSGLTQYFCGNGASASFSDHMALDWSKNANVSSISFGSSALYSAIGNDLGFTKIFSEPIGWHAKRGDILVAISSSGNSPNIIQAIKTAREKEMSVITFTGLRPVNQVRGMGDLNFYIPARTYGTVECAHQVLLHIWIDKFMQVEEWSTSFYQNMCEVDN